MKRSQLKNKANKTKSEDDLIKCKKQQRNLVVKLNKNCKKQFHDNLETKHNLKSFWDKCKPYFSNEHSKGNSNILVIEKDELLLKNKKVADVFNSHFQSITDSLDLFEQPLGSRDQIYESIDRIIDSFRFHPSIKDAFSGLRQFLATESPSKMMHFLKISPQKLFPFSRYLSFCLDFWVMYQNGLIKKIRLISNFMTSHPG